MSEKNEQVPMDKDENIVKTEGQKVVRIIETLDAQGDIENPNLGNIMSVLYERSQMVNIPEQQEHAIISREKMITLLKSLENQEDIDKKLVLQQINSLIGELEELGIDGSEE